MALTSRCLSHVSSVVRRSGALSAIPALLTRTSTSPMRSNVLVTARSSVTSQISVRMPPPIPSSASASRASATTWSPSAANWRVVASPIPLAPPVTTTVLLIASAPASAPPSGQRAPGSARRGTAARDAPRRHQRTVKSPRRPGRPIRAADPAPGRPAPCHLDRQAAVEADIAAVGVLLHVAYRSDSSSGVIRAKYGNQASPYRPARRCAARLSPPHQIGTEPFG